MQEKKKERGLYSSKRNINIDRFREERKTLDSALREIKENYENKCWKTPRQIEKLESLKLEVESVLNQYKIIEDKEKVSETKKLLEEIIKRETVAKSYWDWLEPKRRKKKQKILAITLISAIGLSSIIGFGLFTKNRHEFLVDIESTYEMAEDAYSYGNYQYARELNRSVLNDIGVFAFGKEKEIKESSKLLQQDLHEKMKYTFFLDLFGQLSYPYNAINSFYGVIFPNPFASNLLTIGTLVVPTVYGYRRIKKRKTS